MLNRYGLIAIRLKSVLTIEDIGRKLDIKIDRHDTLQFMRALQADENRIGLYENNLLLCTDDSFGFFIEQLEGLPARILSTFSSEKICAVYYYSVVDLYGYSYFDNGRRIRTKYGEHEDVWVDIGENLSIEKESQSIIDVESWIIEQVTAMTLGHFTGIKMAKFELNA